MRCPLFLVQYHGWVSAPGDPARIDIEASSVSLPMALAIAEARLLLRLKEAGLLGVVEPAEDNRIAYLEMEVHGCQG